MSVKRMELDFIEGIVSYTYKDQHGHKQEFVRTFTSLDELLMLVRCKNLKCFGKKGDGSSLKIDCISFSAKNKENNIQTETLLMKETPYVEVLEKF